MKVITLTAWRRPDYLRQCLDALARCEGIDQYAIIIGLNPDPGTLAELRGMLASVNFGASSRILENSTNIGCNANKLRVLDSAFQCDDYALQIDDDIILAPDALRYFEWCRRFESDPSIFTATCWGLDGARFGLDDYRVYRRRFFTCYGWATWKSRWPEIIAKWPLVSTAVRPWDVQMNEVTRGRRCELFPIASRAVNIGQDRGLSNCGARGFQHWAGSRDFGLGRFSLDPDVSSTLPPIAGLNC